MQYLIFNTPCTIIHVHALPSSALKMHTQCPMLHSVCMLWANQCANDQDNKDDNHRYQNVLTNRNSNQSFFFLVSLFRTPRNDPARKRILSRSKTGSMSSITSSLKSHGNGDSISRVMLSKPCSALNGDVMSGVVMNGVVIPT